MSSVFTNIVEEVKKLSIEEKEELRFLLERYLIEERREEIYRNYRKSLKELLAGKLDFSSDVSKLKEML